MRVVFSCLGARGDRHVSFVRYPGLAQTPAGADSAQGHGAHGRRRHIHRGRPESASTKAYKAAADRMHADMDIRYTGNADVDFMRGMIAHTRAPSTWRRWS